MSWLTDTIEGVKSGVNGYLASGDTPVSGILDQIKKAQAEVAAPGGLSAIVSKATTSTLTKVTTQAPAGKIQADGTFLTPTDSTGVPKLMGMGFGMAALVGVGIFLVLKKV